MKNLNKLSLSDLIIGIEYLEDYSERILQYILSIEKENKKEADLMNKKWHSIRQKVLKFKREIQRRLLDAPEIKTMKIVDEREDLKIIKDYINKAKEIQDIPKGEKIFTKKAYRKFKDRSFLVKLCEEIGKEMKKEKQEYEQILGILYNKYLNKLMVLSNNDTTKKRVKTELYNDEKYYPSSE